MGRSVDELGDAGTVKHRTLNPKATPPSTLPAANDLISRAEFVALIHPRLARFPAEPRNRISRLVTDAENRGSFSRINPSGKPQYRFGDVALWAISKWPKKFSDFPSIPIAAAGDISLPSLTATLAWRALPSSISECHDQLDAAHRRIGSLEAENAKLGPLAAKYRQQQKGGRPKK